MKPRREPMKRTRLRPKKRSAEAFARIYGSKERVEWVKALPCLICGSIPSENAHVGNGGKGRKAHHTQIVPLCGDSLLGHHREYDEGKRSFVERHADRLLGRTMLQWAELVERAWQHHRPVSPITAIVRKVMRDLLEDAS